MDFNFPEKGVPIEEVESCRRHRDNDLRQEPCPMDLSQRKLMRRLALAMNSLHGKSNSGEGGERDRDDWIA